MAKKYRGAGVMKCFNCGTELIWQNCFDFDDYGLTDEGIVTVLWCPNCDTYWEGYQKLNNDEEGE